MERDILVVGSSNMDLIGYVNEFPKCGETIHGSTYEEGCGGKGANQCVTAAKLGAKTYFISKVGNDGFGEKMLRQYKQYNIDISALEVLNNDKTGVAIILVNKKGENRIVIYPLANQSVTPDYVREKMANLPKNMVTVCQNEIPLESTFEALKITRQNGGITIFNAAPAPDKLDDEIYENSTIFCVNESEAETLSGVCVSNEAEAKKAAEFFLKKGCSEVIITLGGNGALYSTNNGHQHIKTPKVTPVDTVGAGDTFVGALALLVSKYPKFTREEMIHKACQVATMSVLKKGTQSSIPSLSELPKDFFL